MANINLSAAKSVKNDEFYTSLFDIQAELLHYEDKFKGKTVFCNCDDPFRSNFVKYFLMNFTRLGLKKLYAAGYSVLSENPRHGMMLQAFGNDRVYSVCDGDFRSQDSLALMAESDMVVTNPPFSLFREYMSLLIGNKKQFLILGNMNAVPYKELFPLIQSNQIWLGCCNGSKMYEIPDAGVANSDRTLRQDDRIFMKLGNTAWFTNLDHAKRHEFLALNPAVTYQESEYPMYDNYDAIEVSRVNHIPCDYMGIMGVPVSFLDKHCPEQFEIIWQGAGNTRVSAPDEKLKILNYRQHPNDRGGVGVIQGRRVYARLFIRRK